MKVSDYIRTFHKRLDPVICNDLIAYYKKNGVWEKSSFSSNKENTGYSSVSMNEYWIKPKDKFYDVLSKAFRGAVDKYIDEYTRITPIAYTNFRLNHYTKGGFMRNHVDNIYKSHGQQYGYPHVTSLVFLNDDYEGGEFSMCDSTQKFKLEQGSVIVFPSNYMYDHEVSKVTKGDRYTCMTWIM
jgi:Rps23 Pro-64 3,4-dihydroxylase Tpa1-like proline 4-hydroxylase